MANNKWWWIGADQDIGAKYYIGRGTSEEMANESQKAADGYSGSFIHGYGSSFKGAVKDLNNQIHPQHLIEDEEDWRSNLLKWPIELVGDLYFCGFGVFPKSFLVRGSSVEEFEKNEKNMPISTIGWDVESTIEAYNKIYNKSLSTDIDDYLKDDTFGLYGFSSLKPGKKVCDCGALKARTTHADWCSTVG